MKNKVTLGTSCLFVGIMAVGAFSSNSIADEWSFHVEPYAMITSIKGESGVGQINDVDVDVKFDDILANLESTAMVHFEAHHQSGWGIVADYGFMNLANSQSNGIDGVIDAEMRQGVLELQGMYRHKLANGYLDTFAGIRWWDNDLSLDIQHPILPEGNLSRDVDSDWIDPVAGLRWLRMINEHWTFLAQVDVGGFGVGSRFTSSVQTGVQYQINDLMTLNLKYKATWVDFEDGDSGQPDYFKYKTVTHGAIIGLTFSF